MYIYEGIVSQKSGMDDGWAMSYFVKMELAFFPARARFWVSDLGHQRCWELDNVFLDFRSAQSPLNILVPEMKKWSSRMRSELTGDLRLVAPLMAGVYDEITIELDLSWFPGHLSIAWYEEHSFARLTTRTPPSQEKWEEIEFDHALLDRFEPCETIYQGTQSKTEFSSTSNPAKRDRPRPPLVPLSVPKDQASQASDNSDEYSISVSDDEESQPDTIEDIASTVSPQTGTASAKSKPPPPPKVITAEKDLGKEKEGLPEPLSVSDHVLEPKTVIKPLVEETKSVVLGPERPPHVPLPVEHIVRSPTRPPPAFTNYLSAGKGKESVLTSEPMQTLQATLGIPPANEMELYQRQVCAQQLGGAPPVYVQLVSFWANSDGRDPSRTSTGHGRKCS